MPILHLKSGAANSSPFATWANAAITLAGANAAMAAGDTLYVSSAHAEATVGISLTVPGTTTALSKILGGTEGATDGLTALANGGVIESNNTSYSISGSFEASHITYRASTASTVQPTFGGASGNLQYHNACRFELTGAGVSSAIKFGVGSAGAGSHVELKDSVFKFGNAAQRIFVDHSLTIRGGSVDAAGTAISGLFKIGQATRSARLICDDFDASACTAAMDVITAVGQGSCFAKLRRIKLPASWTGNLVTAGQQKAGDRFEIVDFSSGTTKYKLWIADYAGSVRDENTIKVTANTRSYKAVTNADCSKINQLKSHEYFVSLASGSAQTITLDVVTDNVSLTDAEAWLEVDYFAASNSSLGTTARDAAADALATPAAQTTSTATWTTTGLTTPVKQKLEVMVTPGVADMVIVRACFAKASTTAYLDDRVVVS